MSIQFGRWNFDGKPIDLRYLERVKPLLAPYGPDNAGCYCKGNVGVLYHGFHTTKESRRETQPHITKSNLILTWDGRLDNRAELIDQLSDVVNIMSTDVEIVAAAYECWQTDCFAKLIGDWALSVWDPRERSLILGIDPIGIRHLHYSVDNDQVTWSTVLDPLVLVAERTLALCEEYIAGWFSSFPATHLTPYVGIHSVPPSSSVLIRAANHSVRKYWDFDPRQKIRYRTDAEYEEHFRTVFAEAVLRRLRSDSPILAELSGGMDSSSIVCIADTILARKALETPRLDTVSYYDDSEPDWNEQPYFTKVEEKRGRTGCHIDVADQELFRVDFDNKRFAATPVSDDSDANRKFSACVSSQGNRVVLSGIGGDEVTGGVPTPTPELADFLARGQFRKLAQGLKVWALNKRQPWFHLFFEAARGFFPAATVAVPKHKRPAPWLNPAFIKRNQAATEGYRTRLKLFGALPTFQRSISTLIGLQRQLGCDALPAEPTYEKRYPYLDRGLLEFLFSVPREQLVRPGERRSLMRRALAGIVPNEILNRKRKAYVVRAPLAAIARSWPRLVEMNQQMFSTFFGIVEAEAFMDALQKARSGEQVPTVAVMRTLAIEFWLASLNHSRILVGDEKNERGICKGLRVDPNLS